MKILNCLVVDDSAEITTYLSQQLKQLILANVVCCNTYEEAIAMLRSDQSFDILFLDVQLGDGKSGLDILENFSKLPPTIMLSAYNFALESYDYDVIVDYLLKPVTATRLLKAINRAFLDTQYLEMGLRDKNYVFLKIGRKIMRFFYEEINHIEAYGAYSKVVSQTSTHLVNEPISNLMNILPAQQFIRIHKSYIINIQKITSYDHKEFFIGKSKIPIGISYKPQLESLFRLFGSPNSMPLE